MEFNLSEFMKYLPDVLGQLDTRDKLIGLFLLVMPLFVFVSTLKMPHPWRGLISVMTLFICFGTLIVDTRRQVEQFAQEAPVNTPTSNNNLVVATPTPTPPPNSGYVIPHSSQTQLSSSELTNLSKAQLRLARNEIFARNGRYFRANDLTEYFSQFQWYTPYTWEPALTAIEHDNIAIIRREENLR